MKNRIKKIIEYENISYTKFADVVGIQRSGVSHLISGRNNPSLEVIQKIAEAFDYISIEWLLLGKGKMIKEEKTDKQGSLFSDIINNEDIEEADNSETKNNSDSVKNSELDTVQNILSDSQETKIKEKKILRVLIFYSDKTFSDFIPE